MKAMTKLRSLLLLLIITLTLSLTLTSCDVLESFLGDDFGVVDENGDENGETENDGDGNVNVDNGTGNNNQNGSGNNTENNNGNGGTEGGDNSDDPANGSGDNSDNNGSGNNGDNTTETEKEPAEDVYLKNHGNIKIPAYSGEEYYVVNNNVPFFTAEEIVTKSYERYDARDSLGRCTLTMACIGRDLMPTEPRGSISSVKPTGWIQAQYDCINTKDLYNRCHLIGFQLTGENANWENLITGTRYMNEAMIPFENMVADYIKETGNHVMYRVTPIFIGDNLVAAGVLMEAYSVEDEGEGISFNVFLYNNQPGVGINYKTGESWRLGASDEEEDDTHTECDYILNTSSKKIHKPECSNVGKMSEKNKQEYTGDIDDLIEEGYTKAGCCNPT